MAIPVFERLDRNLGQTVIEEANSCYERIDHSCFSALCGGDDASLLRERTRNDDDGASDHCDDNNHGRPPVPKSELRSPRLVTRALLALLGLIQAR
jgi:hypothetical protein